MNKLIFGTSVAAVAAFACVVPASAAMSPYYETATILQRVLGDGNLADALRQQSVTSVVLTGENTWEVKSQECTATVTVEFVAAPANEPAMGGGPNFDVKVGASSCQ